MNSVATKVKGVSRMGPGVAFRKVMSLALIAGAAFGGSCASAAETSSVVPVFRGSAHDFVFALSLEGRNGIAVGNHGLVVESADGGKTWARQEKLMTDAALFGVARKDGHCIAVGQSGAVFTSADCKQWQKSPAVTKGRILSVDVNSKGIGYAVGGFGTLLRTADWGKTWVPLTPDWKGLSDEAMEPHLYGVRVAEDGQVTVVGEFEAVIRSSDDGATWKVLHKGKRQLFGLQVLEGGEIYAVGQEGLILKSSDSGASWQEIQSGTKSVLTGVWADPQGMVVVSGIYTILYSDDRGRTWKKDPSPVAQLGWHQAVAAGDAGKDGRRNLTLAGAGGMILSVSR